MKIKDLNLVELLESRKWLISIMNSTKAFLHYALSKDQLANIRQRLKEIDQELVDRLVDDKVPLKNKEPAIDKLVDRKTPLKKKEPK